MEQGHASAKVNSARTYKPPDTSSRASGQLPRCWWSKISTPSRGRHTPEGERENNACYLLVFGRPNHGRARGARARGRYASNVTCDRCRVSLPRGVLANRVFGSVVLSFMSDPMSTDHCRCASPAAEMQKLMQTGGEGGAHSA